MNAAADPATQLLQDPKIFLAVSLGGLYAAIALVKEIANLVGKVTSSFRPSSPPAGEAIPNGNVTRLLLEQVHAMSAANTEAIRDLTSSIRDLKETLIHQLRESEKERLAMIKEWKRTNEKIIDFLSRRRICPHPDPPNSLG